MLIATEQPVRQQTRQRTRRTALLLLVRAFPGRVSWVAGLAILAGVLPAIFAFLVAKLVETLPAAVGGGFVSAEGQRIVNTLIAIGGVLLVQEIVAVVRGIANTDLYRRYDEYLLARGYVADGQFIIIEGWAVEFVPPSTPLVEEALAQAVERDVSGVATRVFTGEHLAAICLQVGRARDYDRVMRFVEAGVLDAEIFEAILERHELMAKWQKFQHDYLES